MLNSSTVKRPGARRRSADASRGVSQSPVRSELFSRGSFDLAPPIVFAVVSTIVLSVLFRWARETIEERPAPMTARRYASRTKLPLCDHRVIYDASAEGESRTIYDRLLGLFLMMDVAKSADASLDFLEATSWLFDCGEGQAWQCYLSPAFKSCRLDEPGAPLRSVGSLAEDELRACQRGLVVNASLATGNGTCVVVGSERDQEMALAEIRRRGHHNLDSTRSVVQRRWSLSPNTASVVAVAKELPGLDGDFDAFVFRDWNISSAGDYVKSLMVVARALPKIIYVSAPSREVVGSLQSFIGGTRFVGFPFPSDGSTGQVDVNHVIADLEILRMARFVIGSYSDPKMRVLQILRDRPPATLVSLDECWNYSPTYLDENSRKVTYCEGQFANDRYCRSRTTW